jgi:hypothetical protein
LAGFLGPDFLVVVGLKSREAEEDPFFPPLRLLNKLLASPPDFDELDEGRVELLPLELDLGFEVDRLLEVEEHFF